MPYVDQCAILCRHWRMTQSLAGCNAAVQPRWLTSGRQSCGKPGKRHSWRRWAWLKQLGKFATTFTQELLLPAALRSARSQQQSKGLVVLCATYGSHPPDADYVPSYQPSTPRAADEAPSQPPPPLLDVTVPLQYAVNNGQLAVPSGVRLMHRMGFFDPCPEAQKSLDVQYMFRCVFVRGNIW